MSSLQTVRDTDNISQATEWEIEFPPVAEDAETLAPVRGPVVQPDDGPTPSDERLTIVYVTRRLGSSTPNATVSKFDTARKNVASWLEAIVTQNLAMGMATEFRDIRPVDADRPPIRRHAGCDAERFSRHAGADNFDALTNADRDRWCV